MTIEELKNQIDHVLKDKKSSSQLYLVLKREDQYSLCRVDWNDKKTEPEIKQLFINAVEQKILSNDELELRELSRADNRGNVLYHYDYDTYPEIAWFSDFSIDAAVQDAEVFDGKTASCEGLFGYVIYIGTMNHGVVLFKKHYPVTLLRHGKNCLLFNSRRMEPIDADILRISGDFQLFKVGTEMYIRDLNIMEKWLGFDKILKKVEEANFCGLEKEIILIDDYSTDGTRDLYSKYPYKVLYHDYNQGKGAALRTGFKEATGDIIVIQDADLEYDPVDYEPLIQLILDGKADVCYGSRLSGGKPSRSFMFHHLLGNKFLSLLTNILYGSTLTDMETCYKAFRAEFIKGIEIKSNRFDFEPEITAKVLKRGARLYELPVSYYGREFAEGKKITWKDGVHAIIALVKYRFVD